jgi:hypothetical protein
MCEYSLHNVASRPAVVGDKLVTSKFPHSITVGFTAVGEPDVAVCLLPGTEIAFEKEAEHRHPFALVFPSFRGKLGGKVARVRQVNLDYPYAHHDALEFPDGRVALLTKLCPGQRATVLQLPASPNGDKAADPQRRRLARVFQKVRALTEVGE